MADFILYLGGVGFLDLEIPESIRAGGAQALAIHKYPGGTRTIDTMGPDDDSITWSGFFEDSNAQARCQQIDIMRRQGQPVPLQWSAYQYLVVVEHFEWDFRRFYHIPYAISLAVVQDLTQPIPALAPDIDEEVMQDLNDAIADAASMGNTSLLNSLSLITGSLATITSIATGGSGFLAALANQIGNSRTISAQILATTDAGVAGAGVAQNFASGASPQTMIANINNLVSQTQNLAAAFDANAKLGRMAVDVGNVGL